MINHSISLTNKRGLHARAASKLSQCANQFKSDITIEFNGKTADAKSIMSILILAASVGSTIKIRLDGNDEQQAWEAIKTLINDRFDEDD